MTYLCQLNDDFFAIVCVFTNDFVMRLEFFACKDTSNGLKIYLKI